VSSARPDGAQGEIREPLHAFTLPAVRHSARVRRRVRQTVPMSQVATVPAERVFRRHPLRIALGALVLSAVLSTAALFISP